MFFLFKVIRSLKKAIQPSANNVTVTFDLPGSYEVNVVPDKIPSIYNGEKTVIYGLLMNRPDGKERDGLMGKAILSGDILGKEFKFEIPFELSGRQGVEEDVSIIHQLAAKVMIQEWQDDGEPYEERHKKEIIELSCDASVVSKYTAYIAVDEAQNKPVSGSMQSYELTASPLGFGLVSGGGGRNCSMLLQSMPIQSEAMVISDVSTMSTEMDEDELISDYLVDDNHLPSPQSSPSLTPFTTISVIKIRCFNNLSHTV